MNNASFIGNVSTDLSKRSAGKNKVVSFSLAVNKKVKGENKPTFIKCQAWNKTAELVDKYLKKGSKVGVTGSMQGNAWENKDGKKMYDLVLNVMAVDFLGDAGEGKKKEGGWPVDKPKDEGKKEYAWGDGPFGGGTDDDIPF